MLGLMQGKGGGSQTLPQGSKPAAPLQGPAPGSMPGKGGGSTNMPQGGNTGLAALFRNNQATGPAAPTTQIAPITAPVRPTIAPPPRPVMQPQAAPPAAAAKKYFYMQGDPQTPMWLQPGWGSGPPNRRAVTGGLKR